MALDIADKNMILSPALAKRKIRRIAFEIAEDNADESAVVILGINGNGEVVAECLAAELKKITALSITTGKVTINKKLPLNARIEASVNPDKTVVILVDDVSNTGRTLLYALNPLLDIQPKKIRTVVLVERSHKLFAIQPDHVGLSVSTTLQSHITVETGNGTVMGAWLH
jgi:pyrimidine operon attenuation protein / uracil phosphoribosyltransferase